MMRPHFKTLTLITLIIAALVIQSTLVQGGPKDEIKFSHNAHKNAGSKCDGCHKNLAEDSGIYAAFPEKAVCGECHDVKDKQDCTLCHTRAKAAKGWSKKVRKTNFLHSQHKDALNDCDMCHRALDQKPHRAGSHDSCGGCHEKDMVDMLCAKCHRDFTYTGLNKLAGFTHKDNFKAEHGNFTKKHARTCTQCHRESFCTDCHGKKSGLKPSIKYPEMVKRGFIHRGDWETLHRLEAKTDSGSCLKCHAQKECSACHLKSGASASSTSPIQRHPAGWMNKASANFHGDKSRSNIVECATCHSQKGPGYCIDCHSAGSGFNPHPKNWSSGRMKMKSDRMCLTCH